MNGYRYALILACWVLLFDTATAQKVERVDIGGHQLEAVVAGSGEPAVVIEAGLGESGDNWRAVQDSAARFTTVVTYSRAGYGNSESSPQDRTPLNIAKELRAVLSERFTLARPEIVTEQISSDGTYKWLLRLAPDALVNPGTVTLA